MAAAKPKGLDLQSGGFDSQVKLHRRRRAGVTDSELPHEVVRLLELRQFNPDLAFSVDASEVDAIHKIAGELI